MPGPSRPARLRGLLLISLAALSWGTTGSVTTVLVADAGAHPLVIGAARMLIAAGLLLGGGWLVTGSIRVARQDRWRTIAMGAAMASFQASYFSAVPLAGISVTALLAICSAPLIIAGLAATALGERLTRRALVALALGVVGTALLIAAPGATAHLSPRFAAGAFLALWAGLSYAVYVVVAKAALVRSAPLPLAGANFAVAALALAPALGLPEVGHQIALGWPWLLYLGVVATGGAYAAYTIGLRDVSASAAGVVSLLEPLTATCLGVLLFGERLGAAGLAGASLLVTSLALLVAFDTEPPAGTPRQDRERGAPSSRGARGITSQNTRYTRMPGNAAERIETRT